MKIVRVLDVNILELSTLFQLSRVISWIYFHARYVHLIISSMTVIDMTAGCT